MPKVMTPEIMTIIMQMGHSDEIALVDAHFPGYYNAKRFYRASGMSVPEILDVILYFLTLETKLFADKPALFNKYDPDF